MNKQKRMFLKGLSKQIDEVYVSQLGRKMTYTTNQRTKVSHEDMDLVNQEYDKEKEYTFDIPSVHEVNHFRRLKRELIKNGVDGVIYYLEKCGFNPDAEKLKKVLS